MSEKAVGIIGATSLVGRRLLARLSATDARLFAYSRTPGQQHHLSSGVTWKGLYSEHALDDPRSGSENIAHWICVAPIWVLPEHFALLESHHVRRVVALSSTSRFTKDDSNDPQEQITAQRLADAESRLQAWAESHGVEWVILRPTLIFGLGQDKNIAEMARFIHRFRFFPLFGAAKGLRQPVHVDDVSAACEAALFRIPARSRAYNISGGETVSYREMVNRVFNAMERPVRLLPIPLWVFRVAVAVLRIAPRHRHWSVAMAERMNRDLVFDHDEATREFGFNPRPFTLSSEDVGN